MLRHPPALGRDTPLPSLPSRSPFLESQHIDRRDGRRGRSAPGFETNDAVAAALHAMEEEAEKEEKTQQHAVAMVLEQSEGEGRGQDPATLCVLGAGTF